MYCHEEPTRWSASSWSSAARKRRRRPVTVWRAADSAGITFPIRTVATDRSADHFNRSSSAPARINAATSVAKGRTSSRGAIAYNCRCVRPVSRALAAPGSISQCCTSARVLPSTVPPWRSTENVSTEPSQRGASRRSNLKASIDRSSRSSQSHAAANTSTSPASSTGPTGSARKKTRSASTDTHEPTKAPVTKRGDPDHRLNLEISLPIGQSVRVLGGVTSNSTPKEILIKRTIRTICVVHASSSLRTSRPAQAAVSVIGRHG